MSDGSSSSREPSPRRYRPRSPGSDAGSVASSPWQGPSSALHPSSLQSPAPSPAPLLRQPVGFGASSNPPSNHRASRSSPSPQHYHPSRDVHEGTAQRGGPPKGKEREGSYRKPKDSSRKGKERDKGTFTHTATHATLPHSQPQHAQFPADAHKKKAFRINAYANDLSAGGTPYNTNNGPYGAAYRADIGPPPASSTYPQPDQSRGHRAPPQTSADPNLQPRSSYYRYDYEKIRESAPANRAKQAAAPSANATPPSHNYTPHRRDTQSRYTTPGHTPDGHDRHPRPYKTKDTHHMHPTNYPYTAAQPLYGDTHDSFQTNYFDAGYAQPFPDASYQPLQTPAPPREKRHKSRSHRQHHSSTPVHADQPQQPPPLQLDAAQSSVRVCRVLTLLIEDKRGGDGDSLLTEVRVPLKQVDGGDVGFWVDAQDVTEELQKGPSRIDGRAKVYTLRGKYKQFFLRISADGEQVCQSANLKVAPDRTLEVFIEDNPPPAGMPVAPPTPPPQFERGLLTPITDPMTTPSPAPAPMSLPGHKRGSHSSLFSGDDYPSPAADEQKFDHSAIAMASKKRPRSSSIQSVQSARSYTSEGYSQPQPHDVFSPPSTSRPSSSRQSTQSRTPSQSSPPPQQRPSEPVPMSPIRASSPLSSPQPVRVPSQPARQLELQTPPAPSPRQVSSSSTSRPSPQKKTKLTAPQTQSHTEHSVSPGPGQPGSYPLSHSRTASRSKEASATGFSSGFTPSTSSFTSSTSAAGFASSSSGFGSSTTGFGASAGFGSSAPGFAAYANLDAKPSTNRSTSSSNAFSRYDAGPFSLPTNRMQAGGTIPSQTNLPIPSVSTQVNLPSVPSLSSVSTVTPMPTTMPPSAMTVTPTLSGQASSDLDNIIGRYIRSIIDKEPDWAAFVEHRKQMLTMREQLPHFEYVQRVFDRFAGKPTPPDLEGAGGVLITKAQVMRAFNLPLAWGERCTETIVLTTMYGPGGTRGEDPRVVQMLDEKPAITPKMTAEKYLTLLREVHGQWTINNADSGLAA